MNILGIRAMAREFALVCRVPAIRQAGNVDASHQFHRSLKANFVNAESRLAPALCD
jgi:hypothetical protein